MLTARDIYLKSKISILLLVPNTSSLLPGPFSLPTWHFRGDSQFLKHGFSLSIFLLRRQRQNRYVGQSGCSGLCSSVVAVLLCLFLVYRCVWGWVSFVSPSVWGEIWQGTNGSLQLMKMSPGGKVPGAGVIVRCLLLGNWWRPVCERRCQIKISCNCISDSVSLS